jgi:copper(I)-binding protein
VYKLLIATICLFLSVPAFAGDVVLKDAWARPALGDVDVTAAFFTAENVSDADVKIITVKASASKKTEIHTMTMGEQGMSMDRLESLTVPAGAALELKPGAQHVMLIGLTEGLKVGDTFTLDVGLDNGTTQTLNVPVRPLYQK